MARTWYAGSPADFAVKRGATGQAITGGGGALGTVALLPEAAVTFNAFAEPGGAAITDLLDINSAPITSVSSSTNVASLGLIVAFQGPDNYNQDIWLTADAGVTFYRIAASTETLFPRVTALESSTTTDLNDWSPTAPTNGQVPIFDTGTGLWTPGASAAAGVTSFNTLTGAVVQTNYDLGAAPINRIYLVSRFGVPTPGIWETRSAITGVASALGVDWEGTVANGEPSTINAADRRTYTG